jgi:hypothetical protein
LEAFDAIGADITDKQRNGYDKQYKYADAIKDAYRVLFFQHPSMLEYQKQLQKRKNAAMLKPSSRWTGYCGCWRKGIKRRVPVSGSRKSISPVYG